MTRHELIATWLNEIERLTDPVTLSYPDVRREGEWITTSIVDYDATTGALQGDGDNLIG